MILFNQSVLRRLIYGVGANIYSQFVTLFIQVASIPVCLSVWGGEIFGVWVALFAIPSFLTTANLGIAHAAGTEMTIINNSSSNTFKETSIVYHTACATTLFMSIVVGLLCVITAVFWQGNVPFKELVEPPILKGTIVTLILYTLVSLFSSLQEAVFKSCERYAEGIFLLHTSRFIEYIILILMLLLYDVDILYASITLLSVRSLGFLIICFYMQYTHTYLIFGVSKANIVTFKKLLPASTGFIAMPIGFSLLIQGMTIMMASISPILAAQFNVTRTITSVGRQIASVVGNSSWPELSKAYGQGNKALVTRLFLVSLKLSLFLSVGYFIVVGIFGEYIFHYLTNNTLLFNYSLLSVLALSAILGNIWTQGYVLLASQNQHIYFSFTMVVIACCNLLLIGFLTKNNINVFSALWSTVAADICLILSTIYFIYKPK